jgi:RNA polymerase sigma-70 factor (ECF subfamily)
VRAREHAAWATLVATLTPILAKRLFRILGPGQTIDDVLASTWSQAYRRIELYDPARPLYPWLVAVARRECGGDARALKGWRRRVLHLAKRLTGTAKLPSPFEGGSFIRRALADLPEADRTILTLRFLMDCSPREVAEVTGLTEDAVWQGTHRALQRLRDSRHAQRMLALFEGRMRRHHG